MLRPTLITSIASFSSIKSSFGCAADKFEGRSAEALKENELIKQYYLGA